MVNDPRLYQGVVAGMRGFLAQLMRPAGRNAVFGAGAPSRGMLGAALRDSSVGGCANAAKAVHSGTAPRSCPAPGRGVRQRGQGRAQQGGPPGQAVRLGARGAGGAGIQDALGGAVGRQAAAPKRAGRLPRKPPVATGMHLIPRHGSAPGPGLTRPGSKNGTRLSGRHAAARCVGGRYPLVLGAYRASMSGSVPGFVERALRSVRDAGIGPGPVLPSRESLAAGTVRAPGRARTGYPVPCRNTGNAVAALRESARNARPGVSPAAAGGRNSAGYHVKIEERKKCDDPPVPEERHVGFATNRPAASARGYPRRRGTGTSYRVTGPMGAKTRVADEGARMPCPCYSLLAYNEWVVVRAVLSGRGCGNGVTAQRAFACQLESARILEPKPPP